MKHFLLMGNNMSMRSLLVTLACVAFAACQPDAIFDRVDTSTPAPVAGADAPLPLSLAVPINAVMVAQLDFAADGIWRPAASAIPLTDAQWLLAEQDAVNLISAATLITMQGTGVNDESWVKDSEWRRWASEMQIVAMEAKAAVDSKDQDRLALVGDRLVELCQACHQKFKPGLPTMGITRFPIYPKHDGTLTPP